MKANGENLSTGWICLYRSSLKHTLAEDKPYNKWGAWIYLLLMANHQEGEWYCSGRLVPIKRGELITSQRKLGEAWGWSRKRVSTFLKDLQGVSMIKLKVTTKYTRISIVNYDFYQQDISKKSHRGTAEEHQRNTNNNDNKDENPLLKA